MGKLNVIFKNLEQGKISADNAEQQILDLLKNFPFIEERDIVVNNYIQWMGENFNNCDRKGLLEAGFREGTKCLSGYFQK